MGTENKDASNKSVYEQLWPYEKEQQVKSRLLVSRLKKWKPLLKHTRHYFLQYQKTHETLRAETERYLHNVGATTK